HQRVLRGTRIPAALWLRWVGGGPASRARNRARRRTDQGDPGAAGALAAGHHGRSEEALLADRAPHAPARRRGRAVGLPRGGPHAVLPLPEGPRPSPPLVSRLPPSAQCASSLQRLREVLREGV